MKRCSMRRSFSSCEFAVLGDLNSCFIVNHKDGWDDWESFSSFMSLLGTEVDHVIEEQHANVGGGSHGGGACGHVFGF